MHGSLRVQGGTLVSSFTLRCVVTRWRSRIRKRYLQHDRFRLLLKWYRDSHARASYDRLMTDDSYIVFSSISSDCVWTGDILGLVSSKLAIIYFSTQTATTHACTLGRIEDSRRRCCRSSSIQGSAWGLSIGWERNKSGFLIWAYNQLHASCILVPRRLCTRRLTSARPWKKQLGGMQCTCDWFNLLGAVIENMNYQQHAFVDILILSHCTQFRETCTWFRFRNYLPTQYRSHARQYS